MSVAKDDITNKYSVDIVIEKEMNSKNYIIDILNYYESPKKLKKQEVYNPFENLLKYFGLFKHDCVSCRIGKCIVQGTR